MALNICVLSLHSSPLGRLGTRDTGGMSIYIRELAQQLGAHGHRVDIFTCRPSHSDERPRTLAENVRLIHLPSGSGDRGSKLSLLASLPDLIDAFDRFAHRHRMRYDIVHSHYWLSGCLGRQLQLRRRIPHMVMFHTLGLVKNLFLKQAPEPEQRIVSERRLAQTSDRVMVASESEKTYLQHLYGLPPAKIRLVPCGVNLDRFFPIDQRQARRQLGLPDRRPLLLYVGRFDPLKRIDDLIEAHARLITHHACRLLIIGGDGPHDHETRRLRRLCRRLQTEADVSFVGRVAHADLAVYYSAADALVLPSRYESFGLVGLEALACGTPVIATKVGAMDRLIQPGVNGCLLTDTSPAGMADNLAPFVTHPKTKQTVRRIRTGVLDFGWPNVAEAIIAEYGTLLGTAGTDIRTAACN